MMILDYLFPDETALQFIIFAILAIAVWVFYSGLKVYRSCKVNFIFLDFLEDVSFLEQNLKNNSIDFEQLYSTFKKDAFAKAEQAGYAIPEGSVEPLLAHVKAIYDAGIRSSRLDADLLVKNTVAKVFAGVDTIRTLISLFLIVGILGTLLGLAFSIGSFTGNGFVLNGQVNNTANELSKLFANLRGAFSPSMWGVIATIFSIVLFTIFIQEKSINRFSERLTNSTINVWLPVLYPTDFQKSEIRIHQLNETIKNAEGINDGAQKLLTNLSESNATVKALTGTTSAIIESSNNLTECTNKVMELRAVLEDMQQSFNKQNEFFNAYIDNLANKNKEEAEVLKEQLSRQGSQIEQIAQSLQQYEKGLVLYQENLKKVAEDNSVAARSIEEVNKQAENREDRFLKNTYNPLKEELLRELNDVSQRMAKTATALERINNPLMEVNNKMHNMFETFGKAMQEMFTNFNNQIQNLIDVLGQKAGLNEHERKQIMLNSQENASHSKEMISKLDAILQALQALNEKEAQRYDDLSRRPAVMAVENTIPVTEEEEGSAYKKYISYAIVALLMMNIILQGFVLLKMSDSNGALITIGTQMSNLNEALSTIGEQLTK